MKSKWRRVRSHGTSPLDFLSPSFACGRPSPHSLAQLATLTGCQPIIMSMARLWRTCTLGILTLGHRWWWSPGGVGTWAVRPSISAICAKRAISARSSPWPRAAVPTRVFGPPPSTELTTIAYARFIVCATRSITTAVATRAPFQHAAMAVCSTSRHGFLRRVEARRAGT